MIHIYAVDTIWPGGHLYEMEMKFHTQSSLYFKEASYDLEMNFIWLTFNIMHAYLIYSYLYHKYRMCSSNELMYSFLYIQYEFYFNSIWIWISMWNKWHMLAEHFVVIQKRFGTEVMSENDVSIDETIVGRWVSLVRLSHWYCRHFFSQLWCHFVAKCIV